MIVHPIHPPGFNVCSFLLIFLLLMRFQVNNS